MISLIFFSCSTVLLLHIHSCSLLYWRVESKHIRTTRTWNITSTKRPWSIQDHLLFIPFPFPFPFLFHYFQWKKSLSAESRPKPILYSALGNFLIKDFFLSVFSSHYTINNLLCYVLLLTYEESTLINSNFLWNKNTFIIPTSYSDLAQFLCNF